MSQKTALVTGAASGIGFAIAESLSKQGLKVLVSDLNLEAATEAAEKLNAAGGTAAPVKLDVTSQEDIDAVAAQIKEDGGRVDVLVNNAGLQFVSKLEEFPVDRWRLLNDVLLVGPAMLTRAMLPLMRDQNFGRIVNIGSIHALIASPFKSAYVAAKHGLIGFSKVVALETADQDITINTICPAYVKTPLVEQQITNQAKEHGITEEEVINDIMLEPMPKKSFISLEELSGSVSFLISDAAKNMTGQTIVLDGAWTAR
ncbi:MAG: 3-hydroxybutyrate dehydrogenase [Cellvibrionaceae bacterium]